MSSKEKTEGSRASLAADHIALARGIASRLHRSYTWIALDDLRGYAYLGLALAAQAYKADRGVPFDCFASRKGMFLAIDEMRKDGVVRRRRAKMPVTIEPMVGDVPDPRGDGGRDAMETRDLCTVLLDKLHADDRRLLMLYYADSLTFRQIARVFGISESAVCLRHKMLLNKLRTLARRRGPWPRAFHATRRRVYSLGPAMPDRGFSQAR